jgi:acylphosphatase
MKKAIKYIIKGRVQGVGYRYFTNTVANRIGVYGYVKNLFNGNVEVYAIGTEEQLINLKSALNKGPSFGSVDEITEEKMPIDDRYYMFDIKF